jgi:hypothetical protein
VLYITLVVIIIVGAATLISNMVDRHLNKFADERLRKEPANKRAAFLARNSAQLAMRWHREKVERRIIWLAVIAAAIAFLYWRAHS